MQRSSQGSDDDAQVMLTLYDQAIRNDNRSWCSMRVVVLGAEVVLRQNDTVRLRLLEDDAIGDDNLWETNFEVTRDEAEAQRVDRTFDCSSNFGDGDVQGGLEIYGQANVNKEECGFICNEDDPNTDNIDVELVDDDDAEQDDDRDSAVGLPLGLTAGRIARDADRFSVNILDPSQVTFRAVCDPRGGQVDLVLYEEGGGQLQVGEDQVDGSLLDTALLQPGDYRVRAQPRDGRNYNFYDVELRIVTGGCEPGAIEVQPCPNCGTRRRTCDDNGAWAEWGECMEGGECAPGDERVEVCGLCGREMQTCNDECAWNRGECEGEGECAAEAEEAEACPEGGSRIRTCDDTCQWGEFGECDESDCVDGNDQDCYGGPDGTEGVGECASGMQTCRNGAWGRCEGEVRPSAEACDDGRDNDCDGDVDDADDACQQTGPGAGDACDDDDDCGDLFECLKPPAAPGFLGGYCGTAGCDQDCPGDAVCGTVFGERFCLQACTRHSECRADYRCADVGLAVNACIPACQRDFDCLDPARPVCDRMEGVCVAGAGRADMRPPPPPRDMGRPPPQRFDMGGGGGMGTMDAGTDGGAPSEAEAEGCSCDLQDVDAPAPWWLALLLMPWVTRRRG